MVTLAAGITALEASTAVMEISPVDVCASALPANAPSRNTNDILFTKVFKQASLFVAHEVYTNSKQLFCKGQGAEPAVSEVRPFYIVLVRGLAAGCFGET
jgi:hypothetical protein